MCICVICRKRTTLFGPRHVHAIFYYSSSLSDRSKLNKKSRHNAKGQGGRKMPSRRGSGPTKSVCGAGRAMVNVRLDTKTCNFAAFAWNSALSRSRNHWIWSKWRSISDFAGHTCQYRGPRIISPIDSWRFSLHSEKLC